MRDILVNIITRTSNRPNYFKRCYDSVKSQTHKNIRHHVISDDKDDLYIYEYNDIYLHHLEPREFDGVSVIVNPRTGDKSIHNLYFNKVIQKIKEGWILILDDDDCFMDENSLKTIVSSIQSPTDMVIFPMQYEGGKILPTPMDFGRPPQLGRIGSPCVMVHSSISRKHKWDEWKCADFRYIQKIWTLSGNKKWIHHPMTRIGGKNNLGNLGNKMDAQIIVNHATKKVTAIPKTKDIFDYVFIISSYNRFEQVSRLLTQINDVFKNKKIKIYLYNDGSTIGAYDMIPLTHKNVHYIKNTSNNGKRGYWKTINVLLSQIKDVDFKWCVQLDDDFIISSKMVDLLETTSDSPDLAAIKLHLDDRVNNWGMKYWVDGGAAYTQRFLTKLAFKISPINDSRWKINPQLSSGVWQQVSGRINNLRFRVIVPEISCCYHADNNISVMNDFRNGIVHQINTKKFGQKVYVVMCAFRRLERMSKTITMLEAQTEKNFEFIVWNNSLQPINVPATSFKLQVIDSEKNIGGIGRFHAVKQKCERDSIVIFIDDDQEFDEKMVEQFLHQYDMRMVKSWWSYRFNDEKNYFNRVKITDPSMEVHYCGTGGMVLNSNIFFDEGLFDVPNEYSFIEDLWLSYYANQVKKMGLRCATNNITIIDDSKDQYKKLLAKKSEFLSFLTGEKKWKLNF